MYDQQILRILLEVGVRGISVKKLAKHVYNHYCTFFFQPDFVEIYRYTQQYIQRNSRSSQGIIEHAEKWGHYRINDRSSAGMQMMLKFTDNANNDEDEEKKPSVDLSLSLFQD